MENKNQIQQTINRAPKREASTKKREWFKIFVIVLAIIEFGLLIYTIISGYNNFVYIFNLPFHIFYMFTSKYWHLNNMPEWLEYSILYLGAFVFYVGIVYLIKIHFRRHMARKKLINKKKLILITIILGIFFQIIASLIYSYSTSASNAKDFSQKISWKPFYVENCRIDSGCNDYNPNTEDLGDPSYGLSYRQFDEKYGGRCAMSHTCRKTASFGFFPYWSGSEGFPMSEGFNVVIFMLNIIVWHGLALLIAIPFSKKNKEVVALRD